MGKPMTAADLATLKTDIDNLLKNRKGANKGDNGSNGYAGASYGSLNGTEQAFVNPPKKGTPIRLEHAEKTAGVLIENFYSEASQNCGEKKASSEKTKITAFEVPEQNTPIRSDKFDLDTIKAEVKRLSDESTASNGVTEVTKGKDQSGSTIEVSSCRNACSGICVGSCIGHCNGCTGCTSGCYSTCSGSCTNDCKGGCVSGCSTGCKTSCTGTCTTTCSSRCDNSCTGCGANCSSTCAGTTGGYSRWN